MAELETLANRRNGQVIRSIHHDFDLCYRAVRSRDPRFDGRFFTGVTTTGIYCRPICPARTPLPGNVRFYGCAAAAEADGFRACQRCHPEASPGSPDWSMQADLVGRALRLIGEGVVDSEGVAGLASRLAVGERHLHRQLAASLGAGPLALARTRRLQMARMLIEQTDMPLTEVAFGAGFASIRQFNDAVRQAFGQNPTEIRRQNPGAPAKSDVIELRLHHKLPIDGEFMMGWLARRSVPGVEEVVDGWYRRSVSLGRTVGVVELRPVAGEDHVMLRLHVSDLRDLSLLVQRCRHLFDLDVNPAVIGDVLGTDPLLAPLVAVRPGVRVPGAVDGFELAVRAILGQQISVAGARTMAARVVNAYGSLLPEPVGSVTHLFPSPEVIAGADLQRLGITRARAGALRSLAREVAEGRLVLDRGVDWESTVAQLTTLPGVGPWTASYISMRALGNPDAFPAGDLGLRQALKRKGLVVNAAGLEKLAEAWRPWRAYGAMHLWASLSDSMGG